MRVPDAPRERVLYFDIDGTLVHETFGAAKRALADGRFERLVRSAGFDRLVCVSDAVSIGRLIASQRPGEDLMDTVLQLCGGTLRDSDWFRQNVRPVFDPIHRGRYIDTRHDWYFVDDWAATHLEQAYPSTFIEYLRQGRVLQCNAAGSGDDIVAWLRRIAQRPHPGRRAAGRVAAPRPLRWGRRQAGASWFAAAS
ncbi:MAG: hypothetical protein R3F05_00520 [Planctomycetota bacterium]|nr:hypothetical protein [Planctomycetota bacterium]MCB9824789.1 hypothetical protein [Planctomycetota bacterium]MCB9899800.1 hypothetical protein [Planctomycetota bacterium]